MAGGNISKAPNRQNGVKEPHLIVAYVIDPELLRAINAEITAKSDFQVVAFATAGEVLDFARQQPVSGLVIDLRFKIRSSGADKEHLASLAEVLPTAEFRLNANTGDLTGIFDSTQGPLGVVAAAFLQRMRDYGPRRLRGHARIANYLNVRVKGGQDSAAILTSFPEFLTNTFDISPGGCFLISSLPIAVKSRVRLSFDDLMPGIWVDGVVHWMLEWGKTFEKPAGCGVEFIFGDAALALQQALLERYGR